MAGITDNYSLIKPEQGDYYNVDDFNENADILDAAVFAAKLKADKADRKSILIAAQNSAADFKNMADHICAARDETVFQAAADRAAETGGTVYIAPGDYDVYTLDIDGDAVFIGLGEVNITTDVRSFFIGAGRTVFRNICFVSRGVYLKPLVKSVLFDSCRFVNDNPCIKIDGDYALPETVPFINVRNCDFEYTGEDSAAHNFIFYTNMNELTYHLTVTESRCSERTYINRGYDYGSGCVINCAGNINISAFAPRSGSVTIPAGRTNFVKDISAAYDGSDKDYRFDTDNYSYFAEVTARSGDTSAVITPVLDIPGKRLVFMLDTAAQSDTVLSYRIIPNEI